MSRNYDLRERIEQMYPGFDPALALVAAIKHDDDLHTLAKAMGTSPQEAGAMPQDDRLKILYMLLPYTTARRKPTAGTITLPGFAAADMMGRAQLIAQAVSDGQLDLTHAEALQNILSQQARGLELALFHEFLARVRNGEPVRELAAEMAERLQNSLANGQMQEVLPPGMLQ